MRPDKWVVKGLSELRRKPLGSFLEGGTVATPSPYSTVNIVEALYSH